MVDPKFFGIIYKNILTKYKVIYKNIKLFKCCGQNIWKEESNHLLDFISFWILVDLLLGY
jgi:hypothetical protein